MVPMWSRVSVSRARRWRERRRRRGERNRSRRRGRSTWWRSWRVCSSMKVLTLPTEPCVFCRTLTDPLMPEANGHSLAAGSGDLIPVIGFFCQRCEEFFADLSSAEGHKHTNTLQVNTLHTTCLRISSSASSSDLRCLRVGCWSFDGVFTFNLIFWVWTVSRLFGGGAYIPRFKFI